jgi:hypothetical protein
MVFIVFTGLVSEVCFFHRATPCANIVRPFRAGGMWGGDCCGLFLRFGFVVCQLQTGEIG